MQLTLTEKTCTKCQLTKPLTSFYRNKLLADGRDSRCSVCNRVEVDFNNARRRSEMGEAAYLEHRREQTTKSRAKTDNAVGKIYAKARNAAIHNLIANHVKEFDELFRVEKYERGMT